MQVFQIIKKLNRTETNYGSSTNDCYIALPRKMNTDNIFKGLTEFRPIDRKDNMPLEYPLSFKHHESQNNQKRISGLGPYKKKHSIKPGDEILIEKVDSLNGESTYYIDVLTFDNVIFFQKVSSSVLKIEGFEILNVEKYLEIVTANGEEELSIPVIYEGNQYTMKIEHMVTGLKTKRAPSQTKFYDIKLDGRSIASTIKYQDYIELEIQNQMSFLKKSTIWRTSQYILEE